MTVLFAATTSRTMLAFVAVAANLEHVVEMAAVRQEHTALTPIR
jgi:hypothetical protein